MNFSDRNSFYRTPRNVINNFQVISAEVDQNPAMSDHDEKKKKRNERDAYVSFLIVTGSTLRYRPRVARPCHYYPIISCITVTVNEVSYYAASWGWMKEKRRKEAV